MPVNNIYPQHHVIDGGVRVHQYWGQLADTGHKFGEHQLSVDCRCRPHVIPTDGTIQIVTHNQEKP